MSSFFGGSSVSAAGSAGMAMLDLDTSKTNVHVDVEQRKQAVMNSIRQELAMSSVQELITVRTRCLLEMRLLNPNFAEN